MLYSRTIKLVIKPAHREQFLQATSALPVKGARENECRTYHYYEAPTAQHTFLLMSEWAPAAAMKSYYGQPAVVDYCGQLGYWLAEPATVRTFETIKHQATTIVLKS